MILSEVDDADSLYIIDSGAVVICIEKSGKQVAVEELGSYQDGFRLVRDTQD